MNKKRETHNTNKLAKNVWVGFQQRDMEEVDFTGFLFISISRETPAAGWIFMLALIIK